MVTRVWGLGGLAGPSNDVIPATRQFGHSALGRNRLLNDVVALDVIRRLSQQRINHLMPSDHRPVVLIVDDDPDERALLIKALESARLTVVDAANRREALRILDTDPTVRVLIADILMLGISGVTLAERAAESRADVPVILISDIESPATPSSGRYWLRKPVPLDELRSLVASLCATPAER